MCGYLLVRVEKSLLGNGWLCGTNLTWTSTRVPTGPYLKRDKKRVRGNRASESDRDGTFVMKIRLFQGDSDKEVLNGFQVTYLVALLIIHMRLSTNH